VWVHPLPAGGDASAAAAAGGGGGGGDAAGEGVTPDVADNLVHAAAAAKTAQDVSCKGGGRCGGGGSASRGCRPSLAESSQGGRRRWVLLARRAS
jgi:hypothetical protein